MAPQPTVAYNTFTDNVRPFTFIRIGLMVIFMVTAFQAIQNYIEVEGAICHLIKHITGLQDGPRIINDISGEIMIIIRL